MSRLTKGHRYARTMKNTFAFIIMLAGLFIIPIHAFAVDYSIENMRIDAFLRDDGKVDVTEQQTYRFNGEFNGITRKLVPKKGTLIMDVEASEDKQPLDMERDGTLYKFYREGSDETITIELTYTIHYAVEAYADVAEFYWPFFDTRNESDYEQLDVFIHPPHPTDDVIAFGYDAAEETATTEKDGVAHFNMGKVPRKTNGDIRVAYDIKLFPNTMVLENELKRDEIIAAKNKLKDKRIKFDRNQSILRAMAPFIIGLFSLYIVALLFHAWRKKRMVMAEVDRLYPLPYFVPKEEMSLPATIAYNNFNRFTAEIQTASLLDLVRKGCIEQTAEEDFLLVNRKTEHDHELYLIDWLFYEIGNNGRLELSDLKDYTDKKSNRQFYARDFNKWKKSVQDEIKQYKLKKKNKKLRLIIFLTSLVAVPFIILFMVYKLFGYMSILLLLFPILLGFSIAYRPRTIAGARIKRDWTAFHNHYTDMSDNDFEKLVDDEQKRALIYGIGVNTRKIKKKNKAILDHTPLPEQPKMSPIFYMFIAQNANPYFVTAIGAASARSFSGGVSGGGGVGGGGGGSGAF